MRNDAQIAALDKGVLLPLLSKRWRIDPNEADDRIVQFFSEIFRCRSRAVRMRQGGGRKAGSASVSIFVRL